MLSSNTSATSDSVAYVEDVFSTWLYTGLGSGNPVTVDNGIDLAGKGGIVWSKSRSAAQDHAINGWTSNARAALCTNNTSGTIVNDFGPVSSTGFTTAGTNLNTSGYTYSTWTFRKQPKFFDVVTYTGTGSATTIAHSLGSIPGCIIVKRTDTTGAWQVYHRSLANTQYMVLNTTAAAATGATRWNSTTPTSTVFSVGTDATVNSSGGTYVAYIFAHDAGGFGLTGTDNVISCGSYTGNSSTDGPVVTLGWEPQWILIKNTSGANNWQLFDNMRGLAVGGVDARLVPNLSSAEDTHQALNLTGTGFDINTTSSNINLSGNTYIYIAIRRGPMKVPTDATKVFTPLALNNATNTTNTTNFPVDMQISTYRGGGEGRFVVDRLRGVSSNSTEVANWLWTNSTIAEVATGAGVSMSLGFDNTSFKTNTYWNSIDIAYWNFRRAPSFFDEVCYTGNVTARTINHNLGAVPELMIVKTRSSTTGWAVYHQALGNTKYLYLDLNVAQQGPLSSVWNNTTPTSSVFSIGTGSFVNGNAETFVAYLFATCAGVSKVGSYTGTGTSLQVDCGFAAGARFVLIKRTDSTGDWYIWDTARGIVSGNDPYLLLNSTAAEVTITDYIDTYSAGFELSTTAAATVNVIGGSYIFLAIA